MYEYSAAVTKPFTSVWTREPRKPKAAGLSREQIVRAAIELLDADGLAALSMRKLGAKLGAGTTSVYWYVANKDELLELALDEIWGLMRAPDPDNWREMIKVFAHSMRQVLLAHPWATSLLGRMPSIGPKAFLLMEQLRVTMVQAGFSGTEVYLASGTLTSFVLGQVIPELSWREAVGANFDAEQLRESVTTLAADYPAMQADFMETIPADPDESRLEAFTFGLTCVIDGLAARISPV